jgi:hypothetical protein
MQCGPGPHGEESSTDGPSGSGLPVHRSGPDDAAGLIVICGRVRVLFGRGQGLFDHLREPLALDFEDDPDMEAIFDRLRLEFGLSRPGSVAMATALMSESLIHVLQ